MEKVILFGCGRYGEVAYKYYGKERILCYIDNNPKIIGTKVNGITVRKVEDVIMENIDYKVILCSAYYEEMAKQLQRLGCTNYEILCEMKRFYPSTEFINNPYQSSWERRDITEEELIQSYSCDVNRVDLINNRTDLCYQNLELFNQVEIETINRCNGVCDFCPVNKNYDTREFHKMTRTLFESIIFQLSELNYSGKIALYSNNEPFLDEDIISKYKYLREKLPKAYIHLWTNGTLLTMDKFKEVVQYLDEMVIDNYQQELRLIKPVQEVVEYCEKNSELKKRVTIVLRKPHEILSNRGGEAHNRKKESLYPDVKCPLPFKQLIIRPDGKVSLCCNDPLGKNTLGDLNQESVLDVWYGEKYKQVRECIFKGRKHWKNCEYCDALNAGGNGEYIC